MKNKKISVLGCGWYGLALAKRLLEEGYFVMGSTTSADKLVQLHEAGIVPTLVRFPREQSFSQNDFFNSDVLFVCIPPHRQSAEQALYPQKIREIAEAAKSGSIRELIFISSTSVHAETNSKIDESVSPQPERLSGQLIWEAEGILSTYTEFRTSIIRFAGLVGPGRDPGRFFSGKRDIPNGLAPVNLIHLEDCIGISLAILQQNAYGHVFHAVTPDHPEKQYFYKKACERSGLPLPHFIPELGKWKVIASNKIPSALSYAYKINTWSEWLESNDQV